MIDILIVILFTAGVVNGIKNKKTPHLFIWLTSVLLFFYYKNYIYYKTLNDTQFFIGSIIMNYLIYYLGYIITIIFS
jgi:hypothetical protein